MAHDSLAPPHAPGAAGPERPTNPRATTWRSFFSSHSAQEEYHESDAENEEDTPPQSKWSMGVLNDPKTIQVPGSVLLLAKDHNTPLGLQHAPARTSHSSIPTGMPVEPPPRRSEDNKKKTHDGKIILEPQPEDSGNDPLNWPAWQRDLALLSLGFYCMLGGGATPLLAAGFTDIAKEYHVEVEEVALTTGFYMMGLGLGSVFVSPTAILFGKRPVYLISAVLVILSCVWCALSPNFASLVVARIVQGLAISPVECLPSATVAEIFFLHERAFRIGIYTLLLLGGKNLIPLVSAAISGSLGWRWIFWIMGMVVALALCLLFLFVPETFWDRTPVPKSKMPKRPSFIRRLSSTMSGKQHQSQQNTSHEESAASGIQHKHKDAHVGFAEPDPDATHSEGDPQVQRPEGEQNHRKDDGHHIRFVPDVVIDGSDKDEPAKDQEDPSGEFTTSTVMDTQPAIGVEAPSDEDKSPEASQQIISKEPSAIEGNGTDQVASTPLSANPHLTRPGYTSRTHSETSHTQAQDPEKGESGKVPIPHMPSHVTSIYTHKLRHSPNRSWTQQLKPFNGRLNQDKWIKVLIRPFILFSYPSVLWSSIVYACSIGWLIVISETMAMIYRDSESYNFTALQTGLVYVSPFVGGILGTGVAGKVSDIVVMFLAKRNGGLYEPEFRLLMAIPIAISTVIGLMGFGWSAEEKDHWIVPTLFFGIISFGCSLGSTTAITFCVDSYRQYAGEALVTLNFSKNVCHGLVFSLFVSHWVHGAGPKMVFIYIGVIQLILLLFTIPMYIFGKRCRMWTVRKNFMEKF